MVESPDELERVCPGFLFRSDQCSEQICSAKSTCGYSTWNTSTIWEKSAIKEKPLKILVTGSTASQCNPLTHERSPHFVGLLVEALATSGADITWQDPDISPTKDTLSKYDKVIVGLASPLALGSNRIYGALNTLDVMWADPRLTLLLDAPDPNNVTRGLGSIAKSPGSLRKDFFSARKGFHEMSDPLTRVKAFRTCEQLRSETWPTTLVPAFPWTVAAQFEQELPKGARGKIEPVILDALLLEQYEKLYNPHAEREDRWMAEKTVNRRWIRQLGLENPVVGLRANHRMNIQQYLATRLNESMGFLHGPSKSNQIWWSPKVATSLAVRTPVFTDWRESRVLGKNWSTLPDTFEMFARKDQIAFAQDQYNSYVESVPSIDKTLTHLSEILDMEV